MSAPSLPLALGRVSKRYGDVLAVDDVSLTIEPGRFVTLLGPSGSGKTTLLMMIAGFTQPSAGTIRLGARDITALPPERRDFGMVFQGYALFPHLSVRDNIAFPLKLRKMSPDEVRRGVDRMLEMMELGGRGDRFPRQLSGGQQQRVALARALVFNPNLLLLDEPLSALDTKLRAGLQDELRALHRRLGATFIFVTHDQEEALSMSDEIAIVNRGRIVQFGTPRALYDQPVNRFVADFLGRSNFLSGRVAAIDGATLAYLAAGAVFHHRLEGGLRPAVGDPVTVALRPEKIAVSAAAPPGALNTLPGRIRGLAYHGADYRVLVETAQGPFDVALTTWRSSVAASEGSEVCLQWEADATVLLRKDD